MRKALSLLKALPTKGAYTLMILLKRDTRLETLGLGVLNFRRGYYSYTGSALGDGAVGLRRRVMRHLRKDKTKHWHIDFLLASESAQVVAVIAAETSMDRECQINNAIENLEGATIPVSGFGASDCRKNCGSHLVCFGEQCATEKVVDVYAYLFGKKRVRVLQEGGDQAENSRGKSQVGES